MNDVISEVYFFGSMADGFKSYPLANSTQNKFSIFYNSTEEGRKLHVIKSGNLVTYTYVKYGLLTSMQNGRTGSCFGISIVIKDKYFGDNNVFINKVCEQIYTAIVKEGIILSVNSSNGIVAFSAFDFNSISNILNRWIELIKSVITENYESYLIDSSEIPSYVSGNIIAIKDSSPNAVILEKLKEKGAVLLGTNYPLVELTEKERLLELEKHFANLQNAYKLLNEELEATKKSLSRSKEDLAKFRNKDRKGNDIAIETELNPNITLKVEQDFKSREEKSYHKLKIGLNKNDESSSVRGNHFRKTRREHLKKWSPLILGVGVLVLILIIVFVFLNDDRRDESQDVGFEVAINNATQDNDSSVDEVKVMDKSNYDRGGRPCVWGTDSVWYYHGDSEIDLKQLVGNIALLVGQEGCNAFLVGLENSIEVNNKKQIEVRGSTKVIVKSENVFFRLPKGCSLSNSGEKYNHLQHK